MIDIEALVRLQEASFTRAEGGQLSSWPHESAMDAGELRGFLDARTYCVLATVSARQHPVARPVAFTVIGSSFWFATVAGSRLRNLERVPWASIVISHGDGGDHRAVIADGSARITASPAEEVLRIWEARHGSSAEWAAAWFEIKPSRLMSYTAQGEST